MLMDVPAASTNDSRDRYESALAAVRASVPRRQRRALQRKLDRLRSFVWQREEMRDLSSQMYYLIRRYAKEIARRRGLGDDVFLMSFQQIVADDRSLIGPNREIYESFRNYQAPHEIGSEYRRSDTAASEHWQGLAASAGTATAAAYVANSVAEATEMPAGKILVCPFTDPGWTPILDRSAGVVTETGGLLSHAAVICREYGIPAVLGLAGATCEIRTGQAIFIDGGLGIVEVKSEGTKRPR